MKPTITMEEWLSELSVIESSDGMTCEEIQDMSGMSRSTVRGKLKQAFKMGRLSVGQKRISRIDGRSALVPCYRIIETKKKAAR